MLWRGAFYRPISEFRQRLGKSSGNTGAPLNAQKTSKAYLLFLEESIQFYEKLIDNLMTLAATNRGWRPQLRTSLSRSFIRLGDLHRYRASCEDFQLNEASDFTRTSYVRAAALWPEAGNAFNQLAVLESTKGNYAAAVYFYLRALHAETPFAPARENLIPLLSGITGSLLSKKYSQMKEKSESGRPMEVLESELFSAYLVDVLGPLYLRVDMDATPMRLDAVNKLHLGDYLNRLKQQARSGGAVAAGRRLDRARDSMPTSIESSISSPPPTVTFNIVAALIMMSDTRIFRSVPSDSASSASVARGYALTVLLDVLTKFVAAAEEMLQNALHGAAHQRTTILLSCLTSSCFPVIVVALEWFVEKDGLPLFPGWIVEKSETNKASKLEPLIAGLQRLRAASWACFSTLAKLVKSSLDVVLLCPSTKNVEEAIRDDVFILPEQVYSFGIVKNRVSTEYGSWEMAWTREDEISIPNAQLATGPALSLKRMRQIHTSLVTLSNRAQSWLELSSPDELRAVIEGFVQSVGQTTKAPGNLVEEEPIELEREEIVFEPVPSRKKDHRRSASSGDDLVLKRRSVENASGMDAHERLAMEVAEQVLIAENGDIGHARQLGSDRSLSSQLPAHGLRSLLFSGKNSKTLV